MKTIYRLLSAGLLLSCMFKTLPLENRNTRTAVMPKMPNLRTLEKDIVAIEQIEQTEMPQDDAEIIVFEPKQNDNRKISNLQVIFGLDGTEYAELSGYYDKNKHTAYLHNHAFDFVDIVEYAQPVTPPNLANPELIPFAQFPNPNYAPSPKYMVGGQSKNVILFGKLEKKSLPHKISDLQVIFGLDGTKYAGTSGYYDKQKKSAELSFSQGNMSLTVTYYNFVDIVEYSAPVTPPNVSNPELIPFAQFPNPKYNPNSKQMVGGQSPNITLFGKFVGSNIVY